MALKFLINLLAKKVCFISFSSNTILMQFVNKVFKIQQTETLKYTLKTDNGSYKVEATDLPMPISRVEKFKTI
jgi:hypothetical protein